VTNISTEKVYVKNIMQEKTEKNKVGNSLPAPPILLISFAGRLIDGSVGCPAEP